MSISANYRKLAPTQIDVVSDVFTDAWMDPHIPQRQYDEVAREELAQLQKGRPSAPFAALRSILTHIPKTNPETTLLDVGASSAYYSEVLARFEFPCKYTALDHSTYYKDLAHQLYGTDLDFQIGSALELPFEASSFDIVLHGAVLMHLKKYAQAIKEAARVAKQWVIFHRTPIYFDGTLTEAFVKTAYGVPCVEFHFNETEIVELFYKNGLEIRATADVFRDEHFGHRSYLLAAGELMHHPV